MNSSASTKRLNTIVPLIRELVRHTSPDMDNQRTELFAKLIPFLSHDSDHVVKEVLKDRKIRRYSARLHNVFYTEQVALESYWSHLLAHAKNPEAQIRTFPFFRTYENSSTFLYFSVKAVHRHIGRALYIGSGALPLNPIMMAKKYYLSLDCLERDRHAYTQSKKLVSKFGVGRSLHIIHCDVKSFRKFSRYDVIILAVLVGKNAYQKKKIIDYIFKNMNVGTLLLVKNFGKLKSILYPSIDESTLARYCPSLFIEKNDGVTNQFIFLGKMRH